MFLLCPYFLYKPKVKPHYKLNIKKIIKPVKFNSINMTENAFLLKLNCLD